MKNTAPIEAPAVPYSSTTIRVVGLAAVIVSIVYVCSDLIDLRKEGTPRFNSR